MYLKQSPHRLEVDLARANQKGLVFAAKVVRGAYMQHEREEATKRGEEDPIWPSIEATHAAYDASVSFVLREISKGVDAHVMLATHNEDSITKAIAMVANEGIDHRRVSFGQLYGMKDYITFALGSGGFQSYKYGDFANIPICSCYRVGWCPTVRSSRFSRTWCVVLRRTRT